MEEKKQALMQRYHLLMVEISERCDSIGFVCQGQIILNGILAREFCFLQLRMICECIALACLSAHGEMKEIQTSRFQNESYADKLMSALERLHPDFYPRPVIYSVQGASVNLVDITEPFLTKADLKSLYRKCGDVLHRGKIKNYTFTPTREQMDRDFSVIETSTKKILRLVIEHVVHLRPHNDLVLCQFVDDPKNRIRLFQAVAPREPSTPAHRRVG